ncbi:hypothetical protein AXG93_2752s1770 [Marchantia polymorpha subsp. ruderalis]|uniref:RNA-directed DNA polymerase n=1 Tax=Marchantia polymorpha subsp. ruderalis TaxID=1480154 RepID=A0A176VV42_MARPO|nr:hypothetical protein AXG93_2752s1770 [Marchantia polymorpha subsp. ruderalis]
MWRTEKLESRFHVMLRKGGDEMDATMVGIRAMLMKTLLERNCPNPRQHDGVQNNNNARTTQQAKDKGTTSIDVFPHQCTFEKGENSKSKVDILAPEKKRVRFADESIFMEDTPSRSTRSSGVSQPRVPRKKLGMDDFSISSSQAKYDVVEDVGNQKANITVGQLIALNPAIRKELRGGLSSTRTKKRKSKGKAHMTNVGVGVVDAAASEVCTHASKIEVRINGHDVSDVLVDGGSAVNAMSERLMQKLGMQPSRPSSIIVGMANKQKVRPLGVVDKVVVSVRGVQTLLSFQILKEASYDLLLGRPWLRAVRTTDRWHKGYLRIGPKNHRVKVPLTRGGESTTDSDRPTDEYWESESEESGSFSEVDTDISTSDQETSSEYSSDDNVQVQVIAAMELLPRPGVKKDPDKVEMSEEEVCRRLSTLRFGPKVTKEEKAKFLDIFRKYIHVFAFSYKDLKHVTLETHRIELEEKARPIRQKQRRINPPTALVVKEEIDKLKEAGFIYEVENSEWVSPIVIVKKKNGKLRVCVDYKKLNAVTKKDYYPLPFIDEILEEVAGHEWYSFGDGYSGYNQIQIALEDQLKTTFTTPWGTFAFRVMPFGLCNAPATFQRFMNRVFEPFIGKFVRDFIDDFCVYGRKADHFDHLIKILQRLEEAKASLNPEKCIFGCEEGLLLGHIISKNGIAVDPEKVTRIMELPFPATLTKLRQFLGMVGYYRRFILSFSNKAHALTNYMKKGVEYELIFKDEAAKTAFEVLKKALVTAPILAKPDWGKPFILYTDASNIAVGCTLSQLDDEKHDHPIAYASRQMVQAEKNYSVTEREALAVIFSLKKFRHYLLGGRFTIVTDHKALKYIFNKPNAEGRIARWKLLLAEFDYTIEDRPGKKHANADLMSRAYDDGGDQSVDDTFPDEDLLVMDTIQES